MEFSILLLIIFGVVMSFGGAIILTFFLVKRVRRTGIRVVVFTKDKKRKVYKFNNLDREFNIGKDKYIFDFRFVIKSKSRDYIYYNEGSTNPIDFKTGEGGDIDSKTFKSLMDSNLIKQLFSSTTDDLFSPNMIVMYIVLIINVIVLILIIVNIGGETLINNPVNREFIKSAVIEAIR